MKHVYPQRPRNTLGFTLVEVLGVLGIVGLLFALALTMLRPDPVALTADALPPLMHNARAEAIRRSTPVVVTWNENSMTSFALDNASISEHPNCGNPTFTRIRQQAADQHGSTTISDTTGTGVDGIYWLPNGTARHCSNHEPITTPITILVTSPKRNATLSFDGATLTVKRGTP